MSALASVVAQLAALHAPGDVGHRVLRNGVHTKLRRRTVPASTARPVAMISAPSSTAATTSPRPTANRTTAPTTAATIPSRTQLRRIARVYPSSRSSTVALAMPPPSHITWRP